MFGHFHLYPLIPKNLVLSLMEEFWVIVTHQQSNECVSVCVCVVHVSVFIWLSVYIYT